MSAELLQLLCAIGFVSLACFLTYKATLPVALKVIDLCFASTLFRKGVCIFLAMAFCATGGWQLYDFMHNSLPELSRFFPLSFFVSGLFVFLALRKPRFT